MVKSGINFGETFSANPKLDEDFLESFTELKKQLPPLEQENSHILAWVISKKKFPTHSQNLFVEHLK